MENDNNPFDHLEMIETIKVPHNRIGVIIGKKGKIKSLLEEKTQTNINISSDDGLVSITPIKSIDDPSLV